MSATEGQLLHWISDQVQRDTCLDSEAANHYAGGLLTGYRLARNMTVLEHADGAVSSELTARGLARLAIEADRAA